MTVLDKFSYALNLNKTKRQEIITKALKSNDSNIIKKELINKFKNTNSSRLKEDINFLNNYKKIVKGGAQTFDYLKKQCGLAPTICTTIKDYYDKKLTTKTLEELEKELKDLNEQIHIRKYINHYLMVAIKCCYDDIVKLLLDKGADVNMIYPNINERYSLTPLIYAIERNRLDIVSLLLTKGANPNLKTYNKTHDLYKNFENPTALIVAISKGNVDIVTLLLEYISEYDINEASIYIDFLSSGKNINNETSSKLKNLIKSKNISYNISMKGAKQLVPI